MGQTSAILSRLARVARPRFAAHGLDRMSPTRQGLAKRVRQIGSNKLRFSIRTGEEMELCWIQSSCLRVCRGQRSHKLVRAMTRNHRKYRAMLQYFW
jgi:hypothetical protein